MNLLSLLLIALGLVFWFWGSWPLLGSGSYLSKLHSLSVADNLGSALILVGLLLKLPREWPLLLMALLMLVIWNTILGYVLAACSQPRPGRRSQ
ncbi:monovalent cation/H(+) antiporter subunit G [Synechococcus sp. CS-1332]|uniref:monovalent cation/H(+) antiporter subunit G n=1 Tax=Synechococcus sp. CS-1332 TaxID=2847972 RepID=UPI00223AFCDE|nr:monovalent cation/H(+) antiporter subunit G [Synechococcus sp. CS-1332]